MEDVAIRYQVDDEHQTQQPSLQEQGYDEVEENLPDYAEDAPPDYQQQGQQERRQRQPSPVTSYIFYQLNRKTQILEPGADSFLQANYTITQRSGPTLFSPKKPELTLLRTTLARRDSITSATSGASDELFTNEVAATVDFDGSMQIPYYPRGMISHSGLVGGKAALACPNYTEWHFTVDGRTFVWVIDNEPPSLLLLDHATTSAVARFSWSLVGTSAAKGAAMGELSVFGGNHYADQDLVEIMIGSFALAVIHFKNMNRKFRSNITHGSYRMQVPVPVSRFRMAESLAWT